MMYLELYNHAEFVAEYVQDFPFDFGNWLIDIRYNGKVDRIEMYDNEKKVAVLYDQDTTRPFLMPKKMGKETRKICTSCGTPFYTTVRKGLKRRCPACVDKEGYR